MEGAAHKADEAQPPARAEASRDDAGAQPQAREAVDVAEAQQQRPMSPEAPEAASSSSTEEDPDEPAPALPPAAQGPQSKLRRELLQLKRSAEYSYIKRPEQRYTPASKKPRGGWAPSDGPASSKAGGRTVVEDPHRPFTCPRCSASVRLQRKSGKVLSGNRYMQWYQCPACKRTSKVVVDISEAVRAGDRRVQQALSMSPPAKQHADAASEEANCCSEIEPSSESEGAAGVESDTEDDAKQGGASGSELGASDEGSGAEEDRAAPERRRSRSRKGIRQPSRRLPDPLRPEACTACGALGNMMRNGKSSINGVLGQRYLCSSCGSTVLVDSRGVAHGQNDKAKTRSPEQKPLREPKPEPLEYQPMGEPRTLRRKEAVAPPSPLPSPSMAPALPTPLSSGKKTASASPLVPSPPVSPSVSDEQLRVLQTLRSQLALVRSECSALRKAVQEKDTAIETKEAELKALREQQPRRDGTLGGRQVRGLGVSETCEVLKTFGISADTIQILADQEIDGDTLLAMRESDLAQLKLKLGPQIKLRQLLESSVPPQ
eukprot:m51a1_g3208 hypothetical protein (547) ;mRNA; f:23504-26049